MEILNQLLNDLSKLNHSVETSNPAEIRATFKDLRQHFPTIADGMSGTFRKELKARGIVDGDLMALLTEGKPTNNRIVSKYELLGGTPKVETPGGDDPTSRTSLSDFRRLYRKNIKPVNMFVATTLEEDDQFMKCKCPRCAKSSFIIKRGGTGGIAESWMR